MTWNKIAIIAIIAILPFLATSCDETPAPTPSPLPIPSQTVTPVSTATPWSTMWYPTEVPSPTDWGTLYPTRTPMPTARDVSAYPMCTLFPTPCSLAIVIQDACLRANGQPIVLDRSGPIWLQARQMFEACPLGPQVTVVTASGTYHAQRFAFGYLFYRDGTPAEMWYMTHLGWEIHAVVPCVNYRTELPMIVQ